MTDYEAVFSLVKRRMESRYQRILFVHEELLKLDRVAETNKAASKLPQGSFEDFVFKHIDFSFYKKIDAQLFTLLYDEGLADYDEHFYRKAFRLGREEVRQIIAGAYIKAGPFYICKNAAPFLLSIMRTLHTSLEFAPLLAGADLAGDESDEDQLKAFASVLNGKTVRHEDGMETKLFVPGETDKSTAQALLCGTFYPLGKAFTVTLIPALSNAITCGPSVRHGFCHIPGEDHSRDPNRGQHKASD